MIHYTLHIWKVSEKWTDQFKRTWQFHRTSYQSLTFPWWGKSVSYCLYVGRTLCLGSEWYVVIFMLIMWLNCSLGRRCTQHLTHNFVRLRTVSLACCLRGILVTRRKLVTSISDGRGDSTIGKCHRCTFLRFLRTKFKLFLKF